MPSDERIPTILAALRRSVTTYESANRMAIDRVESLLASGTSDASRALVPELGEFAATRIDLDRFAALHDTNRVLDDRERAVLLTARRVFEDGANVEPHRLLADVPAGGRLSDAVQAAFAWLGRPFAAVRIVEMVRRRLQDVADHDSLLREFPRVHWSRTDRTTSPPLVVNVDGADLLAGELAPFLDGNQRIVLVVRAPAPPAPLVRLITPGTLVAQLPNADTLADLLSKHPDTPSVVAIMPEGAAEFVHAPASGRPMHERISIVAKRTGTRKSLSGWTMWQQEQELAQLYALAVPPSVVTAPSGNGVPASDPAERLAAWLLSQSTAPVS